LRPKQHDGERDGTRLISARIASSTADALESEAARSGISTNALLGTILKKWAEWDRHVQKLDLMPTPREILAKIVSDMSETEILDVVSESLRFFKDAVIMLEGRYDLKSCIVTLERYMLTTGMASGHTSEGGVHRFTVRHGMGASWSVFVEHMLRQLFAEFVPDREVSFEMSDGAVVISVALGQDWDEHDY